MILVSGATGVLGGMITHGLLERGAAVRVLVREGSDHGALVGAGAEPVIGDMKDAASLARACAGVAQVITTANSASRGGADTAESVDHRGNVSLIDAARDAGVSEFIFVSALGAAAESPVEFFRAKAAAETHLAASGMAWTILQPNLFMEVWIGMLIGLPLQQGLPVTLVGAGDHRHTFVSMRDVAAFVLAASASRGARGRTLVIGGPEAVTWLDVVRRAEQVIGRPIPVAHVAPGEPLPGLPSVVADLAAAMETYETVLDTTPLAAEFDISLTSVTEFLRGALVPATRPVG
ncbi:MAG TPA: SDR family oxidoreductase [Longimicrobiales bacterium]|nr:SDR family oxidoreductase [Longimicrobiales bacterium]